MMQPVRRTPTLMSINNNLLTRVPVCKLAGRNANEAKYIPSLFSVFGRSSECCTSGWCSSHIAMVQTWWPYSPAIFTTKPYSHLTENSSMPQTWSVCNGLSRNLRKSRWAVRSTLTPARKSNRQMQVEILGRLPVAGSPMDCACRNCRSRRMPSRPFWTRSSVARL